MPWLVIGLVAAVVMFAWIITRPKGYFIGEGPLDEGEDYYGPLD